jgi:hypothetical protein
MQPLSEFIMTHDKPDTLFSLFSRAELIIFTLRHILKDRRPCTTAHSACDEEDKRLEIVYGEENIFCTGPTRAAKAGQKSLELAQRSQ